MTRIAVSAVGDEVDPSHTLDALARICNNLFHGERGAGDAVDEMIVRHVGAALKPLVEKLLI